jgi:hypothetical protein
MNSFIRFINNFKKIDQSLTEAIISAYKLLYENFNEKLSDDVKHGTVSYIGRKVIWYGNPSQMIAIHKDYVDSRDDNIYDNDKLNSLTNMIINSDDKVELECSYAYGNIISFDDIREQQESYKSDRFSVDYTHKEKPLSIGNKQLDDYIGSEYLDDLNYNSNLTDFIDYKYVIALNNEPIDDIVNNIKTKLGDDLDIDLLEEFIEIELDLRDAISNNMGDLGTFRVQLRDGHHRVFGAINAGEEYICTNLSNKEQDYTSIINKLNYIKLI